MYDIANQLHFMTQPFLPPSDENTKKTRIESCCHHPCLLLDDRPDFAPAHPLHVDNHLLLEVLPGVKLGVDLLRHILQFGMGRHLMIDYLQIWAIKSAGGCVNPASL